MMLIVSPLLAHAGREPCDDEEGEGTESGTESAANIFVELELGAGVGAIVTIPSSMRVITAPKMEPAMRTKDVKIA